VLATATRTLTCSVAWPATAGKEVTRTQELVPASLPPPQLLEYASLSRERPDEN